MANWGSGHVSSSSADGACTRLSEPPSQRLSYMLILQKRPHTLCSCSSCSATCRLSSVWLVCSKSRLSLTPDVGDMHDACEPSARRRVDDGGEFNDFCNYSSPQNLFICHLFGVGVTQLNTNIVCQDQRTIFEAQL